MCQPDAYDVLCDSALLDGARIAPLFLVFFNADSPTEIWRVCSTNIMGDPDPGKPHSTHVELREAAAECRRMNALVGPPSLKREVENTPLTFTDKIIAKVDELMGGAR